MLKRIFTEFNKQTQVNLTLLTTWPDNFMAPHRMFCHKAWLRHFLPYSNVSGVIFRTSLDQFRIKQCPDFVFQRKMREDVEVFL